MWVDMCRQVCSVWTCLARARLFLLSAGAHLAVANTDENEHTSDRACVDMWHRHVNPHIYKMYIHMDMCVDRHARRHVRGQVCGDVHTRTAIGDASAAACAALIALVADDSARGVAAVAIVAFVLSLVLCAQTHVRTCL